MEHGNISDSGGGDDQWEEIQSLSSVDEVQGYINDENSVMIRDGFYNDSEVFPQGNHEGLQVAANNQLDKAPQGLNPSSSSASVSSSEGGATANAKSEAEPIENKEGSRRWMRMGLAGLFSSRIAEVTSQMRKYAVFRASHVLLFASATTGVGALLFLTLLFMRGHKKRRQAKAESKQLHLLLLIKEKDQKINQLSLKIAQLNEILLERRRVPVLRVG